jgi:hypothetical protein
MQRDGNSNLSQLRNTENNFQEKCAQQYVHVDGWIRTSNWLFSWLWVYSVSWASLVPPAAGNASLGQPLKANLCRKGKK